MEETVSNAAGSSSAAFFALIRNPVKFRLFLLRNLPSAYFSGLRVKEAGEQTCSVTVPYKWFTRNPFRSTYFACLAMAAEMSTGVLVMASTFKRKPAVSMLVVGVESTYCKKATGITTFSCTEGILIREKVREAVDTGTTQTFRVQSTGYNRDGELIAEFWITWSVRVKQPR